MLEVAANILYTAGLSAKFRGKHASAMMCRVNLYNEEKLDFTTTRLLPRPCARLLANEDRLLLIVLQ